MIRDTVYHELRDRLEEIDARVYRLSPPLGLPPAMVDRIYASFTLNLALPDLSVFIEHLTIPSMARDVDETLQEIKMLEPNASGRILRRSDGKRLKLPVWQALHEVVVSTQRRTVLDLVLRNIQEQPMFACWILDRPNTEIPVDDLRQLNFAWSGEAVQSILMRRSGIVRLEESHGPVLFTRSLGEDRVLAAASRVSEEVGLPLDPDITPT